MLICCKGSKVAKRLERRQVQRHSRRKRSSSSNPGRRRVSPEEVRTSLDPTASSMCECVCEWWVGEQLSIHNAKCRQGFQWMDTQKWMSLFRVKHSDGSNRLTGPLFHLASLMHDDCRGWCPFVTVKHYHLKCSKRFVNCESKLLLPFPHLSPPPTFQEKPCKACPINVHSIRECAQHNCLLLSTKKVVAVNISRKIFFLVILIMRKTYF